MELSDLDIFRTVAAEQSVTRAARLLDRVQSNVTTRVKQLEDELGVALFLRDSRPMTLTPEGQTLLRYAERLLALAEEAKQSLRPDVPGGRLRVGSMESAAASRLPRPLTRYHQQWPEVAIEIRTGTSQALVDAVVSHQLDCAVVAHPSECAPGDVDVALLGPGLDGTYLFTEELLLVLPASHPEVRHPEDLRVRSLATFARGCTYRQCAEDWLAGGTQGRPRQINVLELSSYHAILACVTAGSAIAILPKSLLALHREAGEVRTMPVREAHTFLIRRASFTTAACEKFLQALLDSREEGPALAAAASAGQSPSGTPLSTRRAIAAPAGFRSSADPPFSLP